MSHKILVRYMLVFCAVLPASLWADNLIQVYHQALTSDPTFKQKQADWLSNKENLPLAQDQAFFPSLDIQAGSSENHQKITPGASPNNNNFGSDNYSLTLTQPIFNYAAWKNIALARYSVKAFTASYLGAAQDLMSRVSSAYFAVLKDNEDLQDDAARKSAYWQALITARERFKTGLIAITDVYEAKSNYDDAVTTEIQDRNTIEDDLEELRAITGKSYHSLSGLRPSIPPVALKPTDMDQWVKIASRQNYSIKSDYYTLLSTQQSTKMAAAGRLPTLTGTAGLKGNGGGSPSTPGTNGTVALNLTFPVFQGGFVFANTKQSRYKQLQASDQLNITRRQVAGETRQDYLGVQAGISRIHADEQQIKSSREAWKAQQASYLVGSATMLDKLDAIENYYAAKDTWTEDRFKYTNSLIALKIDAGTLSPKDLEQINRWLTQSIHVTGLKKPPVKVG